MADLTGWGMLGNALGGDSELSYQQGLHLGAQTQEALTAARARTDQAKAREDLAPKLRAMGLPPEQADAAAGTLAAGGNLGDALTAALKSQELGFRGRAGATSPDAAPGSIADRELALLGVSNGPQETLKAVGSRGFQDILHPEKGVQPLPAGAAEAGGTAAGVQLMRAFGLLDEGGNVKPGQEALAYEILRNTQHATDVGGVPATWSANPYGAPRVPSAQGLGDAVAPPPGGPAPAAAPRAPAAPAAPAVSAAPAAPAAGGVRPLASVGTVAGNSATIAGAKKTGEAVAEKRLALPDTLNTLQGFEDTLSQLTKAPGFDSIYGQYAGTETGTALTKMIPGSTGQAAANADALRNQLNAKSFQASIQSMRGLGQLSNQEGLKVQTALTRLAQGQISPDEARAAAGDLRISIQRLRLAAQAEANNHVYQTEAEAEAANLPPGTPVAINGVVGTM